MFNENRSSSSMPPGYAEKLHQARAQSAMRGERRVITILFCDVTGSTAMAAGLDPEEWAEIMSEAFDYLIAPVYRYEGTVARLLGDGLLAFFGAPIAHEDDPQRAVLAGLDIVNGVAAFRQEIARDYGLDFNVRVGINTGPVVVGEIGSDLALEYTAMGDAINVASRMESTAEPGTVQIAPDTFRLVEPLFEFEERGPLQIKGKQEPLVAYRVLRLKAQPGRLRGIQGITTPLVGRQEELARLRRAVDGLAETGQGQIVFLLGEAGVGKSRLVDELRSIWEAGSDDGQPRPWMHMVALSYGVSQPYGMIRLQMRQSCDISDADAPPDARAKLEAMASYYPPHLRERITMFFGVLLGVESAASGAQPEGEDFKRELFSALLETYRLQLSGQPAVFVAEDFHWGDPASVEAFSHLFQLVHEQPLLFLGVMRPEPDSAAWRARQQAAAAYPGYFQEIWLQPLDKVESAALVESLLDIRDLPTSIYEAILRRTDGNPFFIEEVVRRLIEIDAVRRDDGRLHWNPGREAAQVAIPDSVQALLMARIDRLEMEVRRTLQLASVIGRTFYQRVLARINDAAGRLDAQLQELEMLALIEETRLANIPDITYAFRHALTRDAAYATILHRHRRRFHGRVAEAFEVLFPDRLEEEAHQLAYHFDEARQWDKALHYYTVAGDQAQRLYARSEALSHYSRAIELARERGTTEQLAYLFQQRGRVHETSGRYADALSSYQELRALAQERGDEALELQSLLLEATIRSTYTDQYEPELAADLLDAALAIANRLHDPRAESRIYWNRLLLGTYADLDLEQVIAWGERAVTIARQHQLNEELAYALHDIARPYAVAGRLSEAIAALVEAGEIWRRLGKMGMLADNRATLALGLNVQGLPEEALALAREALQISESTSNAWGRAYSLASLAPIYLELGQFGQAMAAWRASIPAAEQANFLWPQVFSLVNLALALAFLGDREGAEQQLARAMARAKEADLAQLPALHVLNLARARLYLYEGKVEEARREVPEGIARLDIMGDEPLIFNLATVISSRIDLESGRAEQAIAQLDETAREAQHLGAPLIAIEALQLKGLALLELERAEEATALLAEARAQALASGSRRLLLLVLRPLRRAQLALGDMAAAEETRREAWAEVEHMAASLDDASLRETFLNQRWVRDLAPPG